MTLLDVVLLALVRSIADVLPLSASAHLQMLSLFHGPSDLPAVALATEAGMVIGLSLYFWRNLAAMGTGLWQLCKGRPDSGTRLLMLLVLGSVPALLADWGLGKYMPVEIHPGTIAAAMVVFGLFLLIADQLGITINRIEHLRPLTAIALGLLQVAGSIPGISRMGLVVTASRLLGYERADSARLALLLSIPFLAGEAVKSGCLASRNATLIISGDVLLTATIAGLSTLIATAGLMSWLNRSSFAPFAVWRIAAGLSLLAWVFLH